ncbi:hypothetical protein Tco_1227439 [Tanacetum coccineum]
MTTLKFAKCEGFKQIVDFLNAHPIKYALTVNPTIYTSCIEQFWATVNGEVQLQALVDGKKIIITESIIRRDLQLKDVVRSGRPKRKDTQVPQSSVPSDNVADEAVNEEMDDSLVRAATTASSLEAEQDSVLVGVNTPRSAEDRLKLNELMEFCTKLQQRVLDLENTKTTQAQEITSLKLREDASKQERKIDDIDKDAEITLVDETHGRHDEEVAQRLQAQLQAELKEEDSLVRQREKEANIVSWDHVQAMIYADYQMAQQMQAEEQENLSIEEKSKLFVQLLEARKKYFAAIRAQEKRNKPPTKAQKRKKSMKRVNTFVDMDTELVESSEVRAEGSETRAEGKEEEVAINAIPLATKPAIIIDWKIHKEGKKTYYQIIRADGSSKMYLVFSHMLKIFNRKDLENLYKGRIVGIKRLLDDLGVIAAQIASPNPVALSHL